MTSPIYDINVLYVEDEEFTRASISEMICRKVKNVFQAGNGDKGLQTFKTNQIDIVITDIKMPEMDGLTMCRTIKEIKPNAQIIITTAYSDLAYLLEAIDLGISQYVLKPVELSRLFAAIDKCYEYISLEREVIRFNNEREALIKQLQDALSNIKVLRGLLPICASCKKIRDDKGYWEQIENYISTNSEAEFTHCLCPECMKRLYPQFCK